MQPVSHTDIGRGEDGFNAETKIPDGFWERLRNWDPQKNGNLKKRIGYEGYAGFVPLRVSSIQHSGTSIILTIDAPATLVSTLRSSPIIVYGRLSGAQSGDFSTGYTPKYYSSFTVSAGKLVVTDSGGTSTNYTDTAAELNVYGIRAEAAILDTTAPGRWGWVNHLDTFRTSSQTRAVCGMGGTLYATYKATENNSSGWGAAAAGGPNLRATIDYKLNATFTADAGTNILTCAAHGLQTGCPIAGTTTTTMPGGMTSGTTYYAIRLTDSTLQIATSLANAAAGTAVDITTAGVGTHTLKSLNGLAVPFVETGDISARTDGYITSDNAGVGQVAVASVAYVSSGVVDVSLSLPNMAIVGTLSEIISVGGDLLTLSGMHTDVLNGTWAISAVSAGSNALTLRILVPDVVDDRWDDTDQGHAAILTGRIRTTGRLLAPEGAVLHTNSTGISEEDDQTVQVTSSTSVWAGALGADPLVIAYDATPAVFARATMAVIPLRLSGVASVDNLVRGDALTVDETRRRPRIVSINVNATESVSITGDGTTALITVASTTNFQDGDKILLLGFASYSGEVAVTVEDATHLSFDSDATTTESGVIAGKTVSLDWEVEVVDDFTDDTQTRVYARWIPLEYPIIGSATSNQRTKVRHFDYYDSDEQLFIRSVMAQDSMYFTDGVNPVMKFDGAPRKTGFTLLHGRGLTRAGIPRWQAGFAGGRVGSNLFQLRGGRATATIASTTGSLSQVARGDSAAYAAGARAIGSNSTGTTDVRHLVNGALDDGTNGQVNLSPAAGVGETRLHLSTIRRYYLRLNLIDTNGRVTASATVNSQDLTIDYGADCSVTLNVLRLPWFEGIDIEKIQAEIYATAGYNGTPPYYKVGYAPILRTDGNYVVHFQDSTSPDSVESVGRLDAVSTALKGAEIGIGWDAPPRAKAISFLGGRLALANLRGWHEFDLFLKASSDNAYGTVLATQLNSMKFTFRKSGASGIVTNNSTIFTYEFVNRWTSSNIADVNALRTVTDGFSVVFSSVPGALAVGDWIYLTKSESPASRLQNSMEFYGLFQVTAINSTRISFSKPGQVAAVNIASVDEPNNQFTVTAGPGPSGGHGLQTGQLISMYNTGGGLPTGISADTRYYAIRVSDSVFSIATSYANALAGTVLNFTTAGAGTQSYNFGFIGSTPNSDLAFYATDPTNIPVVLFSHETSSHNEEDGIYKTVNVAEELILQNESAIAALKFSNIINASMAALEQDGSFRPWITAGGGNDWGPDEVYVRFPVPLVSQPELVITRVGSDNNYVSPFVNGVDAGTTGTFYAREPLFPSRVAFAYPNYPEIFDNPFGASELYSDSIVDVNPSDGQEITAIAPLFGESAFGSANKDGPLLVAKELSMHLVKPVITVNQDGSVSYSYQQQPLETNGQGCPYGRTMIPTKHGTLFANDSGLWKINRDLQCVFIGQIESRTWLEDRLLEAGVDIPCATHDYLRNHAQVSFPSSDSEETNDRVLVYDHTRESGDEMGAWTQYGNIPAAGWANVGRENLFATFDGMVWRRRDAGDETDYLDDAECVGGVDDGATAIYKEVDFGVAPFRKLIHGLYLHWRSQGSARVAPTVMVSTDVSADFRALDGALVENPAGSTGRTNLSAPTAASGLVGANARKVDVLDYSLPERRAQHVQFRIDDAVPAKGAELVQVDWLVSPMSNSGTKQAAETES